MKFINEMLLRLLALGLFIPAPLATAWADAGPAATPLNCNNGRAIYDAWTPAREAYGAGDVARAKPILDAIVAACPTAKLSEMPRVMRADIAVAEKDYAEALKVLGDMDRPMANGLGALPSFIALSATAGLKDADGYARERQRLVDGIEQRLTDPGGKVKAKLVERFSVGATKVIAFEGEYLNAPFQRHLTFLVYDPEPFAPPRTIMWTTDPASALLGGPPVLFLDEYVCGRHTTLEIIDKRKSTYAKLRKKVEGWVAQSSGSISATTGGSGELCRFSAYVAPGFDQGS